MNFVCAIGFGTANTKNDTNFCTFFKLFKNVRIFLAFYLTSFELTFVKVDRVLLKDLITAHVLFLS